MTAAQPVTTKKASLGEIHDMLARTLEAGIHTNPMTRGIHEIHKGTANDILKAADFAASTVHAPIHSLKTQMHPTLKKALNGPAGPTGMGN